LASKVGTYIEGEGRALFDLIKQKGMEGIIAKRKASIYRPGTRASDWLKIKARLQQEFVVGGFTEGKGSRERLGALLLGAFRNGKLHYFGHSGSGFSEKGIDEAGVTTPNVKNRTLTLRALNRQFHLYD
jgi:bifunctional non-homologous end joining protein LigD